MDTADARNATSSLVAYRNVTAVVMALTVMQAAISTLAVVGPLALQASGAPSIAIGAVVTANAFGFLVGARIAPGEVCRIGYIRAYTAFAAVAALAAGGLYASEAIAWWAAMQFVVGMCVAGLLAAGESWVAESAPGDQRGSVLGYYFVASKFGLVAGPFLTASVTAGAAVGFMMVALLFTASMIPVAGTRSMQPRVSETRPYSPGRLWAVAPSAVIGAFAAGAVSGSVLQLYSVYARTLSPDNPALAAAIFNGAMIIGSVIAQFPAGMISDRVDRRIVIAGLAAIGAVASLLLVLFSAPGSMLMTSIIGAIWGAGALSYYGITIAHAADRAPPGEATNMMSGILTVWAFGSIFGPLTAGIVMDSALGPKGLFAFSAGVLILAAAGIGYRIRREAPVGMGDKDRFAPTEPTSIAVTELSPLNDEASRQLDLFEDVVPAPPRGALADNDDTEPEDNPERSVA